MKKITKTTQLPKEPKVGQKVIAQVLNVGGWWETHLAWITAMWVNENEQVEEVFLETSEGKKIQHVWAQTKWSRVEVVQA